VRLASRRAPSVVRLERLAVLGSETLVAGAVGPTVRVKSRPDRQAARRLTADLRHLAWVRLAVTGDEATAELYASARLPVRRRLPVAAALALAEAGVPTLLVRSAGR
jgi:hypothetical protein